MKKKEEKVGGLGGSGAADRCEPASCVHRAASQDEHVADQRTLGALMCKHGVNIDAGSLGITLEPSSRSSALVHISRPRERANGCQEPLLRYHTRSPSALALPPPLDQHRPPVTSPANNPPPSWPPCHRPCSPRRWHSHSPSPCSSCTSVCEPSSSGARCANSQARCSPNPVDCGCSGNPCAPASMSPNAKRCSSMVCNDETPQTHDSLFPFQTLMHRS